MTNKPSTPHRFAHEAMGTTFETLIDHPQGDYAAEAAAAVWAEIDEIENALSHFLSHSDIGQINSTTPGTTITVSLYTSECLAAAYAAWELTGGAFDPTATGNGSTGMDGLILDPVHHMVQRAQPVTVNLGGIGKGYALDRVLALLADWGVAQVLLMAGTSTLLAAEAPTEGGWCVGAGPGLHMDLRHRALSASGFAVKGAHIVDPRTRSAPARYKRAWALAPSGALADALSTSFMCMDEEEIEACCARAQKQIGGRVLYEGPKPRTASFGHWPVSDS